MKHFKFQFLSLISLSLLLSGCLNDYGEETLSKKADAISIEVEKIDEHEQEALASIPFVTAEDASHAVYGSPHDAINEEKEITKSNVDAANIHSVSHFLSNQLIDWLNGKTKGDDLLTNISSFLSDDYKALLGENEHIQASTLDTVYESYYKNAIVDKIVTYNLSEPTPHNVTENVQVIYRKQVDARGKESYYEMQLTQNDEGYWQLLDDMPIKYQEGVNNNG